MILHFSHISLIYFGLTSFLVFLRKLLNFRKISIYLSYKVTLMTHFFLTGCAILLYLFVAFLLLFGYGIVTAGVLRFRFRFRVPFQILTHLLNSEKESIISSYIIITVIEKKYHSYISSFQNILICYVHYIQTYSVSF